MIAEEKIPEWAKQGQRLTIFAGHELVAYKETTGIWWVKSGRCNRCGICCEDCYDNARVKEPGDNDRYACGKQMLIPFVCCLTPLKTPINEQCTVRFEAV